MKDKLLLILIITTFNLQQVLPCTMYKITKNGKTIVGNNEDFLSPNNQFWFEIAGDKKYGVMYMGLTNNFAQGAINEAGLVFDGFAESELPILNTAGKTKIWIGKAIKNIMQTMTSVEEVKVYLETIDLSSLSSSMLVFVDKSGTYLIVDGDELFIGEEPEKSFSNFYYSQVDSLEKVKLPWFNTGQEFLKKTDAKASLNYCSSVMENYKQVAKDLFSTQFTTIYDLSTLKIRVYLYHDFTDFIEIDLKQELLKGNQKVMMVDLFPKTSLARKFYDQYNDSENPISFLLEQMNPEIYSEKELLKMEFNETINILGYEWLKQKKNPDAAIKVFKYGVTLMPNNADLYDSLGEAYLVNDDWENAIINYGKSLSLEPKNNNAITKLIKANTDKNRYTNKSFKQLAKIIDQYAESTLKKGNINSLALAIYKDGLTYHNYYGEIDFNKGNLPNDSTLYEIASISKVFVGSLAAKAVTENKISLNDVIRKYLGEDYPNLEFNGTPVTIKNLLTHTLGFETPKKLDNVFQKTQTGFYENKKFEYSMSDLLEELKTVNVDKKPGTYYNYNNVGPELVAYILQQVYKKPYKKILQEFLDELDMKNTYLQDYEIHKNNLSNSYDASKKIAPLDKNPLLGGAFGIISTLPDLTKFMKFQLEGNSAFIKESTCTLFKDKKEDEELGYLWDVGTAEREGFYYQKSGTSNGVQSVILVCPDTNYGLVLIMNNKSDAALNDWLSLYNKIERDLIEYPKINLWSLLEAQFFKNPKEVSKTYKELAKDDTIYFSDSNYLNAVGYDYIFNNQPEKAVQIFQLAISVDTKNANLYDSLGEAYFTIRDYKNALISFKKSLELNPNNVNAKDYINKINLKLKK
jgi:CubicO group peptidase (beta-lactamase class C family)